MKGNLSRDKRLFFIANMSSAVYTLGEQFLTDDVLCIHSSKSRSARLKRVKRFNILVLIDFKEVRQRVYNLEIHFYYLLRARIDYVSVYLSNCLDCIPDLEEKKT